VIAITRVDLRWRSPSAPPHAGGKRDQWIKSVSTTQVAEKRTPLASPA
jgi:hypothetical protein